MEFEVPNRSNWKKRHKLVGIGYLDKFNSNIVCICFIKHHGQPIFLAFDSFIAARMITQSD
jgi:hypothetical protein